ncbi:MAG: hypothetical protein VKS61_10810 [Candidatus Sericytochromatia bacterium]|nr:hypothetical protein [Candidatus Sericytochromatia bacterium]
MTRGSCLAWGCVAVGLSLAACRTGQGTTAAPTPVREPQPATTRFEGGEPLLAGLVIGRVCRLEGGRFVGVAGASVTLDGGAAVASTVGGGAYGFERVAPGVHRVTVTEPGMSPMNVAFRVGGAAGLGRVNLGLVPQAPEGGSASEDILLAGVAVDPRGCALPGATVRVADSLTSLGNAAVQADGDGFWSLTLEKARRGPLTSGVASLTAYGRTPGGIAVEAMEVLTVPLRDVPSVSLVAATRAFSLPTALAWESGGAGGGRLRAEGLPRRRDELVVRLHAGAASVEVLPASLGPDGARLEWAASLTPSRVELLPLGLVPASGEAPGLSLTP